MHVSVNLKWEPSKETDTAGYKIYWAASGQTPVTILTLQSDQTSLLLVVDLHPLQHYRFWVSSYDKAGNESTKRLLTTVFVAG